MHDSISQRGNELARGRVDGVRHARMVGEGFTGSKREHHGECID